MNKRSRWLAISVLLPLLSGCGGAGSASRETPSVFLFAVENDSTGVPVVTPYLGTTTQPKQYAALAFPPIDNAFFDQGISIQPKTGRIFYFRNQDLHVIQADGTGDQVFYTDPSTGDDPRLVGFLPDGSLSFMSFNLQFKMNVSTKAITSIPQINNQYLPNWHLWNHGATEFLYQDTFPTTPGQIFRQPANGGVPILVTSNAKQPEFASDGNVLVIKNGNVVKLSPNGTFIATTAFVTAPAAITQYMEVGNDALLAVVSSDTPGIYMFRFKGGLTVVDSIFPFGALAIGVVNDAAPAS